MNVFDLFARLSLDSSEYESGLDKALGIAGGAAKAIGTAFVGATTAVSAVTKSAIDGYAEYEQLVGGVETLFGDSAQRVVKDASNAFQTAGMTANEYMETSIQSAASLINALDGDQEKAAELMNVSITDMADNVNKMGTTMEAVQNAYRGFSRGNFTMLDNLALGFAGTKAGMRELLVKAQEISEIEYNIDSYADIVQAIHVVQENMGIAGTTAMEASDTISGSTASVKSAWQNLIIGIADENANFERLIGNVVETAIAAANNLIPRISQALSGIGKLIEGLAPVISDALPRLVTDVIPSVLNSAGSLMLSVAEGFIANLPVVLKTGINVIQTLAQGIVEAIPVMLPKIVKVVASIAKMLTEPTQLENLINAALQIILALTQGLIDAVPDLVREAPEIIRNLVEALVAEAPQILGAAFQLVVSLGLGLIEAIPEALAAAAKISAAIIGGFEAAKERFLEIGSNVVEGISKGISDAWDSFKQHVKDLFNGFVDAIKSLLGIHSPSTVFFDIGNYIVNGLLNGIKEIWNALTGWISDSFDGIINTVKSIFGLDSGTPVLFSIGQEAINGLWDGVKEIWGNFTSWISDAFSSFVSSVKSWLGLDGGDSVFQGIGSNMINGLWDGIQSVWGTVRDGVGGLFTDLVDTVSELLDEHSPSKVFFGIGKYIGIGAEQGIESTTAAVEGAGADLANSIRRGFDGKIGTAMDGIQRTVSITATGAAQGAKTGVASGGMADTTYIVSLLERYLPQIANIQITLDGGTIVGELTPGIDSELGWSQKKKVREGYAVTARS